MQVNLESFVLYNTAMNALLLFSTGRLSGLKAKVWRLALASAVGAAYAVFSSVSGGLFLQAWYWKLLCACGMAALAFLPGKISKVLRAAACFFLSALLLGGTGFSLMYLLGARGYGWGIAALIAVLGIAGCILLARGWRRARIDRVLFSVCVKLGQGEARFDAMLDTGNRLIEPVSGLPVLVVEKATLGGIELPGGRPVAFSSMAGGGILTAFEPDEIFIDGRPCVRAMIAVCTDELSKDGGYAALLPLACIPHQSERRLSAC